MRTTHDTRWIRDETNSTAVNARLSASVRGKVITAHGLKTKYTAWRPAIERRSKNELRTNCRTFNAIFAVITKLYAKTNTFSAFSVFCAFHWCAHNANCCKHSPAATQCVRRPQLRRTQFSDICCNYFPTSNNFHRVITFIYCPINTHCNNDALIRPQFTNNAHKSCKFELASANLDERARPSDRRCGQSRRRCRRRGISPRLLQDTRCERRGWRRRRVAQKINHLMRVFTLLFCLHNAFIHKHAAFISAA